MSCFCGAGGAATTRLDRLVEEEDSGTKGGGGETRVAGGERLVGPSGAGASCGGGWEDGRRVSALLCESVGLGEVEVVLAFK